MARTVGPPTGTVGEAVLVDPGAAAAVVPPGAPADHGRFPCFDGLRAVASVGILVHHVAFASNGGFSPRWGPYYAELTVGVYIFFVISGFLLYQPFAVAHLGGRPAVQLGSYFRRRGLRIYPAYWVALALAVYVLPVRVVGFASTRETVANFLLIQRNFTWANIYAGLPQAWTLVSELSFYVFLPAYAWAVGKLARRSGVIGELAGLAVVVAIGVAVQLESAFGGSVWQPLNVLPFFLPVFGAGMLLAVGSAWVRTLDRVPAPLELIGRLPYLWWALALACFVGTVEVVGIPARGGYTIDAGYARVWTHTLVGFFLLIPAVFGPQDRGLIRGFLRWRPWAFLGVISYGLYLWHLTIASLVRDWWWGSSYKDLEVWQLLVPVFGLTVAAATVSWYLVERPCIDLSRRPWRRARV